MITQTPFRWPSEPTRLKWRGGFTLIEMMVAIAILSILLSVAIPSMTDAVLGSKLSSYANNLSSSALMARSEAIKRNATVSLCVSSDGTTCGTGSWEQGWLVLSGATVLQRQDALPTGLKVTEAAATSRVDFRATGLGATTATFTICRASPSVGAQERVVAISGTGRTSVRRTANGACP